MSETLVVTVVGPDKPGLVERLARVVTEQGGNWEASRMARLAGQFAGIIQIGVGDAETSALTAALESAAEGALQMSIVHGGASPRNGIHVVVELLGTDRVGLVAGVTRVFAAHTANVDELETRCTEAPMGGGNVFRLTAQLLLATESDIDALRKGLEDLANDLMVDIRVDQAA